MTRLHVANMKRDLQEVVDYQGGTGKVGVRTLDTSVLAAAWRGLSFLRLESGASIGPRVLADSEVILFVTKGRGRALAGANWSGLEPGSTLGLLKGGTLQVINDDRDPLELVLAELGV